MPRHQPIAPFPPDIDPLIRPLVETLANMGFNTCGSCEGHLPGQELTPGSSHFPLVMMRPPRRAGLIPTLAYITSPRGWCWYRQNTGAELLECQWILYATSAPPYLNPQTYGSYCLTPIDNLLSHPIQSRRHTKRLHCAHRDLLRLVTGIRLYMDEIGLLPDPKFR